MEAIVWTFPARRGSPTLRMERGEAGSFDQRWDMPEVCTRVTINRDDLSGQVHAWGKECLLIRTSLFLIGVASWVYLLRDGEIVIVCIPLTRIHTAYATY